jgi:hypothetical protein
MLIRYPLGQQTEGLRVGCGGMGGWRDGRAVCEVWVDRWAEGEGKGVYGFSSLVKQNKKGKNCAVFCFAGKRKFFFYIYAVITWAHHTRVRDTHLHTCTRHIYIAHTHLWVSGIYGWGGRRGVVCLVANLVWRYLGVRNPGFTVTWVFGTLVLRYSG